VSRRRIRSGLIVVWVVLAGLVAVIVALEWGDRHATSERADRSDTRRLLPVPVSELAAFEIADAGTLHRFERDAAGAWFYHGAHGATQAAHRHDPDPARSERIERALAAFGRARIEREVPLGRNGDPYGVATPELVILAYRAGDSQPLVQYAVGHVAPDTVSRYVHVVGNRMVVTIPAFQIDNLRTLIQPDAAASQPSPSSGRQ
jgi:hypothetical protein